MKKLKTTAQLILSLSLTACKFFNEKNDYEEIVKKTQINPKFEMAHPIATKLAFEVLEKPTDDGNNIRFIAEFSKENTEGQFLALLLDDKKVVLRDDGKGADKTANDQQFSIFIKDDIDRMQSEFEKRQKGLVSAEGKAVFNNRSLQAINTKGIRSFNFDKKSVGKMVTLPKEFVFQLAGLADQKKTLMITDLSVVGDPLRTFNPCTMTGNPNGVWTFGALMRQMASPNPGAIASDAQASAFVLNWLNTWTLSQTVNGESLAARNMIQSTIIAPWLARSLAAGAPAGELKMQFAPFKLMAIVNRLDLRGNSGYGFSNAGEGRFVFNAFNNSCNALQFTVIFEYGINKRSCTAVKSFAQAWEALNGMSFGSAAYNTALENITNQFTLCGTNTAKPNQNSINQIRTNEIALGLPWELREFNLMASGQLALVTVKQEPAVKYNAKLSNADVTRLVTFVNNNASVIENNNYTVPDNVPLNSGSPTPTIEFLGGKSHTPTPSAFWDGTTSPGPTFITSDAARHVFSLNTCSGCHGGETNTFFTHIKPSNFGAESALSGFLTGITVSDPANRPTGNPAMRSFNDLLRRENDLNNLIANTCTKGNFFELAHKLSFKPIKMTH